MLPFPLFKPFANQLVAGFTTREEGNFKEDQPAFLPSLKRLSDQLGITEPVTSYQVHGDAILVIQKPPVPRPTGDALITRTPNLPLMVKVADCQGVLIFDPKTRTIAAVHSGWRGSAQNIVGKTITRMAELGCRPADLLVAVSPSIGPCCAEFTDPIQELPPDLHPFIHGKRVDFWAATKAQCLGAGVPESGIELPTECTRCHADRYFSHRHGDPERIGVFIALCHPEA